MKKETFVKMMVVLCSFVLGVTAAFAVQMPTNVIELTVVTSPPVILTSPVSANYYESEDPQNPLVITLACTYSGQGVTIWWTDDVAMTNVVADGTTVDGTVITGAATGTLVLTGAHASDTGSYVCHVSNPLDQVASNPAVITVSQCPLRIFTSVPAANPVCVTPPCALGLLSVAEDDITVYTTTISPAAGSPFALALADVILANSNWEVSTDGGATWGPLPIVGPHIVLTQPLELVGSNLVTLLTIIDLSPTDDGQYRYNPDINAPAVGTK